MNKPKNLFTFQEAKIQASILLKSIKSSDKNVQLHSLKRFQRLSEFASLPISAISIHKIKYKHALAVIAKENGFISWIELKSQIGLVVGGFLNKWFTRYQEAKIEQQNAGGFLFPYKNQFFICEANYIENLGLEANDADWQLIQWDWIKPADKQAWQRLYQKWMSKQETKK